MDNLLHGCAWVRSAGNLFGQCSEDQLGVASDYQSRSCCGCKQIKSVGPVWGSWQTWRGCNTDNVICHQQQKSRELLDRAFQAVCNFYVPRSLYEPLGRPVGVRFYDGDFDQELDHIEDIVAMHLASAAAT
jgi:hypothetical protein